MCRWGVRRSNSEDPIVSWLSRKNPRKKRFEIDHRKAADVNVIEKIQQQPSYTLPTPENGPSQKETIVFQPSIFRCELLVSTYPSILRGMVPPKNHRVLGVLRIKKRHQKRKVGVFFPLKNGSCLGDMTLSFLGPGKIPGAIS